MRKKIKIGFIFGAALVMGIMFYINPAYSFEKEDMDMALREELAKIDDIELKRAILEEYKEILLEQMPELEMEENTCIPCEADIEELEIAAGINLNEITMGSENFSNENENLLEKETVYETTTEIVREWVPGCGCDKGSWEETEVTTTEAVGETVSEIN